MARHGAEVGGHRLFAPAHLDWWIGWLFMIGSTCFAVASLPVVAVRVDPVGIGWTYFIGSVFFTSAASLQFLQALVASWEEAEIEGMPGRMRWLAAWPGLPRVAAAVQLAGTVFFNVTTYEGLDTAQTTQEAIARVWAPDAFGSVCFLVASELAVIAVCGHLWTRHRHDIPWRIARLNMWGSIFFGISAITSFILPATGEVLDAEATNLFTFLGAVCFLAGAWLLLPPVTTPDAAPAD